MKLGIDVSTYYEELAAGVKYYIKGKEVEPLHEFLNNGVKYSRIRLWNNPYSLDGKPYLGGTTDMDNFVKLAKHMASLGYEIILDIHYSDFWADPGKQTLPKAWTNLTFEELKKEVYKFTKETLERTKAEGIKLSHIQIGNEITNGFMWPLGRLFENGDKERTNYENFTSLLKEGIKATRELMPETKIIIHLERSYDIKVYDEVFSNLKKYDVDYDFIGMSYYPYWHRSFDELFANVEFCKKKFNKEVIIAEVGYGFTMEDYIKNNNGQPQLKIDVNSGEYYVPYPLTKEGQKEFIKEFLKRCIEHNIDMAIYWEPIWIPGENICWASKEGQEYINEAGKSTRNEWANQCLFDYQGEATPAFFEYKI